MAATAGSGGVTAAVEPSPVTRERLSALLQTLLLPEQMVTLILLWADAYAANLIEKHARPDDRWGPPCT